MREVVKSVFCVVECLVFVCNVMEFGDNLVNFDLWFWIMDLLNGMFNVCSDVYFVFWDSLMEYNIEILFL